MVSTELVDPRPGEIWLTVLGAGRPGEPGKTRPTVVLSRAGQVTGSAFDLVVVVPVSASLTPTATRPPVPADAGTGLDRDSVIVCRALRGLSPSRLTGRLGRVPAATLAEVKEIVAALLDLP